MTGRGRGRGTKEAVTLSSSDEANAMETEKETETETRGEKHRIVWWGLTLKNNRQHFLGQQIPPQ